jgi:SAM-dependent methyltransferase
VNDTPFTGERLHEGSDLFAVDLARHHAAYEIARRELGPGWTLDLGCGSGYGTRSLSHPDLKVAGLDRVVSFQVVEHLEDPSEYIDAIATLLRPDGLALITTPNLLTSDGVNPFHVHEYRADELAARLSERFDEVEMQGIGLSPNVAPYFAQRLERIEKIMRIDPLGLRNLLPQGLVTWLFAKGALLVRRGIQESDSGMPEATVEDFPIGAADAADIDLLAVCRKAGG